MAWLRLHPYLFAIGVAGALVVIGALVVVNRSPETLSPSTLTWQGGVPLSVYQSGTSTQSSLTPEQIAEEVIEGQSGSFALPSLSPATSSPDTSNSGSINYVTLLAQLSASSSAKTSSGTSSSSSILSQAYQFIPQGLIATSLQPKKMTASQQELYLYGNVVGGEIQSFETLHTNQAQILKDQAEDRTNPVKAAALVNLGQDLASIGVFMQGMQDVPTSVGALHSALVQSYEDIGAKLQLIAKTQTDATFVQAVENYDTSVNTFIHNYATLAEYFSAQGVVFSSQDPGNVFTFSETGGL